MKTASLIALLAAGAVVAWFASDSPEDAPRAPAAQPAAQPAGEPGEEDWGGGEVVVPRAHDGHFYAEVMVDGVGARMLVDTGASVVALTGADAEAMGIEWDPAEVRPVARGAGGPVSGVPVVLGSVQLGDLEANGVEAIVVPRGLGVSLLGQSFLSRFERIEMSEREMVLGG